MPCLPMGISVRCGRTSALNLLRSMPKYEGASRKRMMRGFIFCLCALRCRNRGNSAPLQFGFLRESDQ